MVYLVTEVAKTQGRIRPQPDPPLALHFQEETAHSTKDQRLLTSQLPVVTPPGTAIAIHQTWFTPLCAIHAEIIGLVAHQPRAWVTARLATAVDARLGTIAEKAVVAITIIEAIDTQVATFVTQLPRTGIRTDLAVKHRIADFRSVAEDSVGTRRIVRYVIA